MTPRGAGRWLAISVIAIALPASAQDTPRLIELRPSAGPLRAAVAPGRGGELASLQLYWRGQWVELLYRGRDYRPTDDFEGRAPILWPATGRNLTASGKTGWTWRGTDYPLRIHGFARDNAWRVRHSSPTGRAPSITLELTDTPASRALYPFGFRMTVRYAIAGDTLTIAHKLRAAPANREEMPFSIGNHITFHAGLTPDAPGSATRLTSPATKVIPLNKDNTPSGEIRDIDLSRPRSLSSFGKRTPVSLTGFPRNDISVRMINSRGVGLEVAHVPQRLPHGTPVLFNLWGDLDKGFFSPEPWVGKQNSLERQDGVVLLKPGESYDWTIRVKVTLPRG